MTAAECWRWVIFMRVIRFFFLVLVVVALSGLMACGSGSGSESDAKVDTGAASGVADELAAVSGVFAAGELYSFDDFVAAGWKKSKQFDVETVPGAVDIWYGFFAGRDIEIRFYKSHDMARSAGFDSAAEVVDLDAMSKVALNAAGGSATTKYKAFAVVGNTVMLCEFSLDSCVALVDALDAG
jgi:hypothetical protein